MKVILHVSSYASFLIDIEDAAKVMKMLGQAQRIDRRWHKDNTYLVIDKNDRMQLEQTDVDKVITSQEYDEIRNKVEETEEA